MGIEEISRRKELAKTEWLLPLIKGQNVEAPSHSTPIDPTATPETDRSHHCPATATPSAQLGFFIVAAHCTIVLSFTTGSYTIDLMFNTPSVPEPQISQAR
ncbi:hypothetical protein V8F06_003110 [Rhypophila decipiens]